MTNEERQHLLRVRDALTETLSSINKMLHNSENTCKIDRVRGESASMPDSFSEDKESFIAP